METAIMGLFALFAVAIAKRREILRLRWCPSRGTAVALLGAAGIAALSAGMLLLRDGSPASRLVHYVLLYAVLGVALPLWHTLVRERKPLAALGFTTRRLGLSLALNLVLGSLIALLIVVTIGDSRFDAASLAGAAVVLLVGCTFEAVFYYGYLHLRLEEAFGALPAILLASALYVLWHTGTQLPRETDVPAAILKLFCVGVMYQSVFGITHNVAAVWPCFLTAGALIDFATNLDAIPEVAAQLPWALLGLALMVGVAAYVLLVAGRRGGLAASATSRPRMPRAEEAPPSPHLPRQRTPAGDTTE